jgi:hypothetical protein
VNFATRREEEAGGVKLLNSVEWNLNKTSSHTRHVVHPLHAAAGRVGWSSVRASAKGVSHKSLPHEIPFGPSTH